MNRLHIPALRKLIPVVFSLCLGMSAFTSCEIYNDEPIEALWMQLDRDSIVLMMGDTCRLSMWFDPDTVTNVSAFWEVVDSGGVINVLDNGEIIATQPGETDLRVVATNSRLEDTCHVTVIEDWREMYDTYPYDMLVYADVDFRNAFQQYHNDAKNMRIAAFIDGEMRGFGEVRTDHGITYTLFRIWHYRPRSGVVNFRYYLPYELITGELEYEMYFDGEVHGSLNNLIPIKK